MKLADAESTENHERGYESDHNCQLPTKDKANQAAEEKAKTCLDRYSKRFCCEAVDSVDVLCDDVCKNTGGTIFAVKPPDVFVENRFEQFDSQSLSQVFASNSKEKLLAVGWDADANAEDQKHYGPEISEFFEFLHFLISLNRFS